MRTRMNKPALLLSLLVATTLAGAPNASAGDGIRTYATCNVDEQRPDRDATCSQGDAWGGVLIADHGRRFQGDTRHRYWICVRGPGVDRCRRETARGSKPDPEAFSRDMVGTYRLTWVRRFRGRKDEAKAYGRVLDKDQVRLRSAQ